MVRKIVKESGGTEFVVAPDEAIILKKIYPVAFLGRRPLSSDGNYYLRYRGDTPGPYLREKLEEEILNAGLPLETDESPSG